MATYYWVGGNGTWNNVNTANWAASSGGAAGAGPPLVTDNVVFDSASGTGTCATATGAICNSVTLNSATLAVSLGAALSIAGNFTLTAGVVSLGSFTLTASAFLSSNSNTRTIDFGTGKIVVTGASTCWTTNTTTGLTIAGTPVVDVTYAGAVAVSTNPGALPEASALSFNFKSGTYALTVAFDNAFKNLNFTGFAGSVVNTRYVVYGSLTLGASMSFAAGTNAITFASTSPQTISTNGVSLDIPLTFNGVGGSWALSDNLTVGSSRTVTLTNGTLNGDGKNVSLGSFALGSGTKTLNLGSGTWTVTGATWDANTNVSNLTVSASTGVISMTSGSTKTFAGGAKTWPTLNQGGSGALTIQQSNTFANITNTVQPATITLTSGTTQTVTDFDASGTSGNLITLNASTPGSRATLTDSGGVNSVSYMDIKDIAATGYGEWQAYTSNGNVDSGNNAGWVFAAPPPLTVSEYQVSFKSFTERRSF
jgi:hypothetical protein